MTDAEEPRPEVQQFLRDNAGTLDRDAAPVGAHEAENRTLARSLEPSRRWVRTPATVAGHARRRPAVAAAVIAALLLGSLGGFAAGRSSAPGGASVAARGATQDNTAPTVITKFEAVGSGAGFSEEVPQMTRLFLRTTEDGVAVRGYLQTMDARYNAQPTCDVNSWCPPPECNPSTYFMAELSNEEAVAQSGSPQYPVNEVAEARGQVPLGQMEGAPASAYMVQTNAEVANVRATWPDGSVDEMVPVEGWAIVAHNGATPASTLEVVLADGSTLPVKDFQNNYGYSYPAECNPPPPPPAELPPAGDEQPADADAAKQSVTEAYQYVFTNGNDKSDNGLYLEDAENLKSAGDQAKSNFTTASDTITVEVGEIRFLSATEAALYFELKYDGGMLFGKQVGYAKLIDGRWKIARDTMCMVFGWAGSQCDPPPDPARSTTGGGAPPPGSYSGPTATTTAAASDN